MLLPAIAREGEAYGRAARALCPRRRTPGHGCAAGRPKATRRSSSARARRCSAAPCATRKWSSQTSPQRPLRSPPPKSITPLRSSVPELYGGIYMPTGRNPGLNGSLFVHNAPRALKPGDRPNVELASRAGPARCCLAFGPRDSAQHGPWRSLRLPRRGSTVAQTVATSRPSSTALRSWEAATSTPVMTRPRGTHGCSKPPSGPLRRPGPVARHPRRRGRGAVWRRAQGARGPSARGRLGLRRSAPEDAPALAQSPRGSLASPP